MYNLPWKAKIRVNNESHRTRVLENREDQQVFQI